MNQSIDRVLQQLAATFTARDIMVETGALARAPSKGAARELLAQHPEYDYIPLPATGQVAGYLRRDKPELTTIGPHDLICDGTSLLELPQLLTKREFFFVLSSNTIAGFVHFSDLNKSVMKIPFFVLFEAVERYLWPLVSRRLNEADLIKIVGNQRAADLKEDKAKAQKKDVDVGWTGLLSFNEIVGCAVFYEIIRMSSANREILADIRNRVAHSDKLLVTAHKDTALLVKTRELCQRILNNN